jgi:flagellar basal body-associated protein FliL
MESEIIVVLVLIALALGFIIWVRVHSQAHDTKPQSDQVGEESRSTKKS